MKTLLLFLLALGGIYIVNFWSLNIPINYDESTYISISKFMMDFGSILTPIGLNQAPLFFKPPATYWQAILGMSLWGQSIFGARFGLIPIHCLSILLFFLVLKRLKASSSAIIFSTLLFAFSFTSFRLTRNLIMENLLACWVLLSLWLLLKVNSTHNLKWLWINSAVAGVACLIKGFIALPMYGIMLGAFLWAYRQERGLSYCQIGGTLLLHTLFAISIGMFWPAMMLPKHGSYFWNFYVLGEHFSKFDHTSPDPVGLIFSGLCLYSLPFMHFILTSLTISLKQAKSHLHAKHIQFLLLSLLGLIVLFLIPSRRALNYVLPFVSITFLLCGLVWDQTISWIQRLKLAHVMNGSVFIASMCYLFVIPRIFEVSLDVKVLVAGCGALCLFHSLYRPKHIATHVGILCLLSFLIWTAIFPTVIKPKYAAIGRPTSPELPVCVVEPHQYAYGYYVIQAPFLPNMIHTTPTADEVITCTQKGDAVVLNISQHPEFVQLLHQHGYEKMSSWSYVPNGLAPHLFWEAIRKSDPSAITESLATYVKK